MKNENLWCIFFVIVKCKTQITKNYHNPEEYIEQSEIVAISQRPNVFHIFSPIFCQAEATTLAQTKF